VPTLLVGKGIKTVRKLLLTFTT